jgi:hypothetical protein
MIARSRACRPGAAGLEGLKAAVPLPLTDSERTDSESEMFKLLWSNPQPPKGGAAASEEAPDGDTLKMLAEHFPIGRKVRYFPEYQRDIVFHTIIIAWRVNDQDIYSREAILKDAEYITCQRHGYHFSLNSGACREFPEYNLKLYPVKVEGDDILVEI